jgi:hypothetical protein
MTGLTVYLGLKTIQMMVQEKNGWVRDFPDIHPLPRTNPCVCAGFVLFIMRKARCDAEWDIAQKQKSHGLGRGIFASSIAAFFVGKNERVSNEVLLRVSTASPACL